MNDRLAKRAALAFIIALIVAAAVFIAIPWWRVDRCLDAGGRWADPGDYCSFEPEDDVAIPPGTGLHG